MEADDLDAYWAERGGAPGTVQRHLLIREAEKRVIEAAMEWALGEPSENKRAGLLDACLVLRAIQDPLS